MPRTFPIKYDAGVRLLIVLILAAGAVTFGHLRRYAEPAASAAPPTSCASPNFSTAQSHNVSGARAITTADLNKDGKTDLVVANNKNLGQVSVLLGNGSGGFSTATNFQAGTNPISVVTADFDKDGNLDVATANNVATSCCPDISILFGDGTGNFPRRASRWLAPGITTHPTSLATGDFNADGNPDLALTNGGLFVLLGNGAGDFSGVKFYIVGSAPGYVVAKDLNGDNKLDLAVANNSSQDVSVLLGDGAGNFGAATNFSVGVFPVSILAEDFNGDGKVDLATANGSSQNVSILLGTGTGSFNAANNFSTGTNPSFIASGDFNGDGHVDLAATTLNNVLILLGDGAGAFTVAASFPSGGSDPRFVTASDFNADGLLDLSVANSFSNRVSILLNDCASGSPATTVQFQNVSYAVFNEAGAGADGKAIITVTRTGDLSGSTTVDYATSDGTASAPADYASTSGTISFAPGEFYKEFLVPIVDDNISEGDETINLALTNPTGGASLGTPATVILYILASDGKPTVSANDLTVTEGQAGTVNAVFTVALSNPSSATVTVAYATADWTATAGEDYTSASGTLTFNPGEVSKSVTVSVKGDTAQEIDEAFYLNLTSPTNATIGDAQAVCNIKDDDSSCSAPSFGTPVDFSVGSAPGAVVVADVNNDGSSDLAVANISGNSISILLGNGAGSFAAPTNITVVHPNSIVTGDFNKDGKVDLATTNGDGSAGKVALLLGNGAGGFAAPVNFDTASPPIALGVGDFNADGKLDLAAANLSSNNISVLLGDGAGGFAPAVNYAAGTNPNFIAVGDFNGDTKPDLAVTNLNSFNVSIFIGNGAGAFAPAVNFSVSGNPTSVAASDFNGDGKLDLAVTANNPGSVAVLMGNGAGGFSAPTYFAAGDRPNHVTVADFNNDGQQDLVVANVHQDFVDWFVSVLFGNGKGSFSAPTNVNVRRNPYATAVSDFDKNGRLDIAVTNLWSNSTSLLLNTCAAVAATPVSGRVTDVSGNGIASVTLTISGAPSGLTLSTQTDAQGNYSLNNTVGGDTLTPSKTGYTFSPSFVRAVSSRGITPITGTFNFKGGNVTYTVSGQVIDGTGAGISNVLMELTGSLQGQVLTDANGNFSFTDLFALGNYTITPSKTGYAFNPSKAVFTGSPGNRTRTFVGTTHPYTISGQIKDTANNPLPSVFVTLSRAGGSETITTLTDINGNYAFLNVASEATYTVTPSKTGYNFNPMSATFSNPGGNQTANFTGALPPVVQFSQTSYSFNEADPSGVANITVTRTGDPTIPFTVDYATSDQSGMTPCQTNDNGIASDRCDYATAAGTLRFAAGELSKTIQIPLINDAYIEPDEVFTISLRNAISVSIGTPTATITLTDNKGAQVTINPIDGQGFFIKQQYIDFLGRVAEPDGFNFWMNRMNNCPPGQICDRIDTSQRFFQSDEFQERGFYVFRLYDAILGRLPKYAEFVPDVARLNGYQTVAEQRASKDAYLLDFISKQEFRNLYGQYLSFDLLTATDAAGFVNALCAKSGITPANKQTLIDNLQNKTKDPAHTLEDFILQPEMSAVGTLYYDRGFITMQYFGYLRRDPEQAGFAFWVGQLIGASAPHKGDYRFMVGGFLQSDEYRFRFALISGGP